MSGKAGALIQELSSMGASIVMRRCDVANKDEAAKLIAGLSHMPPVMVVIVAAMVLYASIPVYN